MKQTAVFQYILNYYLSLEPARNMAQGLLASNPTQAILIMFMPNRILSIIVSVIAKISYGSEFLPGSRHGY